MNGLNDAVTLYVVESTRVIVVSLGEVVGVQLRTFNSPFVAVADKINLLGSFCIWQLCVPSIIEGLAKPLKFKNNEHA